jgi:hypothetical protein
VPGDIIERLHQKKIKDIDGMRSAERADLEELFFFNGLFVLFPIVLAWETDHRI